MAVNTSDRDVFIDLLNKDHKTEAYMELNPNGKIPTLIDHGKNDFVIFESSAMIKYLVNEYNPYFIRASTSDDFALSIRYDPEYKISVADRQEAYRLEQCEPKQPLVG